jgi:hypothetical protein
MAEPVPEEKTPIALAVAPPARTPVALATVALVIAAAALFGIVRGVKTLSDLEVKVAALEATQATDDRAHVRFNRQLEGIENAVTLLSDQQTDLTNPNLQRLRHGFAVSELKLTRQDTAVLVEGRIINLDNLRYRDPTFRLKVGDRSKEFPVDNLGPGASSEFDVTLPNLPIENARTGTFSLVSAAIEYAH